MTSALMIFIDGVGIGKKDPLFNPFFKYGFKTFESLFGKIPSLDHPSISKNGVYLFPVDARLGVDGLPQSGTGQTSIYCGMNAAKYIGKHFGPYPYSTLIPVIKEQNIFRHYLNADEPVFFANAYPKIFFDYINSGKSRLSTTSLACRLNGQRLNTKNDVRTGKALTAEITNYRWNARLNANLPEIKAEIAARRLLRIAAKNKFTLFEYYMTDHLGHGRHPDELDLSIKNLDDFLFTILTEADDKNLTLIICSDHGNFEDLSVKMHTLNPSLCITAGMFAKELAGEINDLTMFKPSITRYIK